MTTARANWPALDCERCSLAADGVVIRYHHTAPESSKPWLLIALPFGIPVEVAAAALDAFRPVFNVMIWENRYVLNLNVPFAGDEPLAPTDHVEDMLSVMSALGVESCRLIGYCSGAGFALVAAAEHPDRFSDLVLVNGEFQLFRRGHVATTYQHSIDRFLPVVASDRETATLMFTTIAEVGAAGEEHDSLLQLQMNVPFSHEERLFRYARSYMAYRDFDAPAVARRVPHSTLVIGGRRDEHTDPENAQAIAEAIPQATLVVDEDADHYAFCRARSATLDVIARHFGLGD
jgi:pimeloyl-ACP methyl ester carboxylesterase